MNAAIYSLFISLALRMTVVTVFVMFIKLMFREKLSAAAHCAIWSILLAQLLFCLGNISIPARTSIYNVVREVETAQTAITQTVSNTAHIDVKNIIALIYAAGTVCIGSWYISVFVIHRIKLYKSETVTDRAVLERLEDIKSGLGIMSNIVLKRGGYAHTLSDTVVLPDGYSAEEERQIILHELCHYKHRDNLKLWAAVAVICFNWFNPLVWIAFRRFRRDIEMYCDDSVLKLTDNRKEYARVLVKTASDNIRFVPGASSAANGTHEVTERVRRIAAWKRKKPVWLVIAILSSVCVSCLCLTDAVSMAVENTVTQVTATPEPIAPTAEPSVGGTAAEQMQPPGSPTAKPVPKPHPTAKPAPQTRVTQPPVRTDNAAQTPAVPTAEAAAAQPEVTDKSPEPANKDVSVSSNGNKETYSTDDGKTVVLHYDNGDLQTGYILDDGE